MEPQILIIIPARGGSKGIPEKNIQVIGKFSLVQRACLLGLTLSNSTVVLSTDSERIASEVRNLPVKVFFRSPHLGSDSASTEDVMTELLRQSLSANYRTVILIQPTSPFVHPDDLAAAVKLHKENPETTVFSAKIHHCFTWILKQKKWEPLFQSLIAREPRQTQPLTVAENGAFWVFDKVRFLNFGTRYCGAPVPILTKSYSNYEIDEYEDLVLARSVADRIDKFLPHLTKE